MQVVCGGSPEAIPRRLVWCPHVANGDQSTGEGEEDSLLLAVSHGSKVSAHILRHLLYPQHPYNVHTNVCTLMDFVVCICSIYLIRVCMYVQYTHTYYVCEYNRFIHAYMFSQYIQFKHTYCSCI